MSTFLRFKEDIYCGCRVFYKNTKLSNNQMATILFIEDEDYMERKVSYYVTFAVANKRKHIFHWLKDYRSNLELQATGRCGLEALLWAKEQIQTFESWAKEHLLSSREARIVIGWADGKRKRVYRYALEKMGYTYNHTNKCMSKILAG